jgi:hypothetical protein
MERRGFLRGVVAGLALLGWRRVEGQPVVPTLPVDASDEEKINFAVDRLSEADCRKMLKDFSLCINNSENDKVRELFLSRN